MPIALIDADIVAYRAAAVSENDPHEGAVLERIDWTMQMILDTQNTKQYQAYLTGSNNFRKLLCPTYKANRKDKLPPKFLNHAREHLVVKWKARVSDGCEADDLLGIAQCESEPESTVICSIDKDLLQIPGKHWNFVNGNIWNYTPERAIYNFYLQMLIGDVSDNVPGIPRVGLKTAPKLLNVTKDEKYWYEVVVEQYNKYPELNFDLNWKLLWIARTHEYLEEIQDEAHRLSLSTPESESTPSLEVGSMETSGTPVPGDVMAS